jgi:hypothetical protein
LDFSHKITPRSIPDDEKIFRKISRSVGYLIDTNSKNQTTFTFQLLKGTCVNCHKFMCKTGGIATRVLLAQLKCLDLGMIDAAMDIQRSFNEKKPKENDSMCFLHALSKFYIFYTIFHIFRRNVVIDR